MKWTVKGLMAKKTVIGETGKTCGEICSKGSGLYTVQAHGGITAQIARENDTEYIGSLDGQSIHAKVTLTKSSVFITPSKMGNACIRYDKREYFLTMQPDRSIFIMREGTQIGTWTEHSPQLEAPDSLPAADILLLALFCEIMQHADDMPIVF